MIVTHLKLKNWRNFRDVDVNLTDRTYLLGANASGKSNFLDVFRFLRDISKPQGGGLQKAIHDRGGIQKLRCLHARSNPEVLLELELATGTEADSPVWRYKLGFTTGKKGSQQTLISTEQVFFDGKNILDRPDEEDRRDNARLTQTALEQIAANSKFRDVATYFGGITYLHIVPQLLKYADQIGGKLLEDDPFGQGFLDRVARSPPRTREARLKKIARALELAVPQFKELRYVQDGVNGRPHLEALYSHHRPNAGWQREEQFSDGTLRLLGLLWVLLEGDSLLLLEEPELSLNDAIVKEIPLLLNRVRGSGKRNARQIVISTHSEALLSNPGIDGKGVLRLTPTPEGTTISTISEAEAISLQSGLSVAEVILPKTRPQSAQQLALQFQ
jgi:predicted ATPase